jgi:hypothetical protein
VKQLLEFPLQDGGTVVVEVDEDIAGTQRAARPGEVAAQVTETFEAALAPVAPAAEALLERLGTLSKRPEEITVQFGVKLTGKLNAIIASSAGEANFAVNLKWTPTPKPSPDAGAAASG